MSKPTPITIAYGDGIGPEIMEAVLKIISYSGANIEIETIDIGEQKYKQGFTSGIGPKAWESIKRNKILFKAPITTPQGGGYKSLNVTLRKALGLYANIRPAKANTPFVKTNFPDMDLVVVRENEEDLYAGVEYRVTNDIYQSVKLISRPGCERIVRYAFEYAKNNDRKKVSCFVKDNIMKMTDGLFHKVFDEISAEYPDIETDSHIVDIAAARVATNPGQFDVIVTENLYGDIISDITAQISGSVGLAGSSNIGDEYAMFEAIHGSAPTMAGQNRANPSGLLQGAILMLNHIGQGDAAEKIQNAWLKALEDGQHTADIYDESTSKAKLGTQEFADEVIKRLGDKPTTYPAVEYKGSKKITSKFGISKTVKASRKEDAQLVGVDVFVKHSDNVDELAEKLHDAETDKIRLKVISIMGQKAWPIAEHEEKKYPYIDGYCCRFKQVDEKQPLTPQDILLLLSNLTEKDISYSKLEYLQSYDGELGYSKVQGE